jgi:glycerol-3-phosphate acyltransferase PlsY
LDNEYIKIVLLIIISYLIGSIPFSFLIGKLFYNTDIRQFGSKNVGATNVFRVLGKKAGIAAMILDAGKGYISLYIAKTFIDFTGSNWFNPTYMLILCGIFTVIGHNWTLFLRFKGGKGVATSIGVALALAPIEAGVAFAAFLVLVLLTRYVSVSSIFGSIVFLVAMVLFKEPVSLLIFGWLACLMIIVRHIPNIKRLFNGTENKIWQKKLQS